MSRRAAGAAGRGLLGAIVLTVVIAASTPLRAQTARSGGGASANAQVLQQMQELASARTALEAENAKLKKDLEDVRRERDELKKSQGQAEQRVQSAAAVSSQCRNQLEASDQELKAHRAREQECAGKFGELVTVLKKTETEGAVAAQTLAERERQLGSCVDHNAALLTLNEELAQRLEHPSLWSSIAEKEPLTRLARIRRENLADDYRAKAADQRVPPASNGDGAPNPTPRN